ncbi:MAG TPA: hypothetical protein VM387_06370 [Gemmatimonadales bacterium]|nr:hypothetical protein [Gemmatimonadales bacterium]
MPLTHPPCRRAAGLVRTLAGALSLLLLPPPAAAQTDGAPATVPGSPVATRVCLAPATVEAVPGGFDPETAVRETFTSFLTGPSLAVTPLQARLVSQAREEAKLAGCAFLLFPTIKHERKTGGGGFLGKVVAGGVQQGAWSASGAAGGTVGRAVASAAAGAAAGAASDYAANSQVKDELTLKYRLESAAGKVLIEKADKRKAKSDGEDLLTPLVRPAAEAVAQAAAKP